MKELSIEQKAKRYDEAIEIARKIANGEPIDVPDGTPIPLAIFPELAESEDEKIRKAIICGMYALKDQHKTRFASIPIDNAIAWLEKQSKQEEPQVYETENGEVITYSESKGYEWNPTWSKEDEDMIETLVAIFEVNYPNDFYKVNPIGTTNMQAIHSSEIIKWLKSLKLQNRWKPSDEQMQALSNAGNSFRPFEEGHKILWSLYNDLKKLREDMKKTYIKPQIEVENCDTTELLCASRGGSFDPDAMP